MEQGVRRIQGSTREGLGWPEFTGMELAVALEFAPERRRVLWCKSGASSGSVGFVGTR